MRPACTDCGEARRRRGASFRYVSRDSNLHSIAEDVLFDEDGTLEELLPAHERKTHLLMRISREILFLLPRRVAAVGCVRSCRPPYVHSISSRSTIESTWIANRTEARERGLKGNLYYPYVTDDFLMEDWDFEDVYWRHWKA